MECSVCFIGFDAETYCPRILPCGHSFCTVCIHKLFQQKAPKKGVITCPQCNQHHSFRNVESIAKNFSLVENILNREEALQQYLTQQSNINTNSPLPTSAASAPSVTSATSAAATAPSQTLFETNRCCAVCQKTASLRCSRCSSVYYCSRDCQSDDWSTHKTICKKGMGTSHSTGNLASPAPVVGNSTTVTPAPPADEPSALCSVCQKAATSKCSRCSEVFYCTRECQVADWPTHKATCAVRYKKIALDDLTVNQVHRGRYIEGTIVSEPVKISGVTFEIEDDEGDVMMMAIYNYPGHGGPISMSSLPKYKNATPETIMKEVFSPTAQFNISRGERVRIDDPFCKIAMDGRIIVRVDDFSKFHRL